MYFILRGLIQGNVLVNQMLRVCKCVPSAGFIVRVYVHMYSARGANVAAAATVVGTINTQGDNAAAVAAIST